MHISLHVCLTVLGHDPNEKTDGALGYLLPDLDRDITKLLTRLNSNLVMLAGRTCNISKCVRLDFPFIFRSCSIPFGVGLIQTSYVG